MALVASANQYRTLPLATAYVRNFFVGVTGLTLTGTLSKAGGAFAAAAGTIAEISSGWYKISLTTVDTNTQGDLAYHFTDGGSNILDFSDQVAGYVTLADKVSHGGTLGSSTATLAMQKVKVSTATGNALELITTGGTGLIVSTSGVGGVAVALGSDQGQVSLAGRDGGIVATGGDSVPAVSLVGPFTTPGPVVVVSSVAADSSGLDGGPGIQINTGAGDAIKLVPAGGVSINAPVPTTGNTTNSIMDCLNAARADGFGQWILDANTRILSLYAADNTTVVGSFLLDSVTSPLQRVAQ